MRENQDKTLQQLAVSPIVHSPLLPICTTNHHPTMAYLQWLQVYRILWYPSCLSTHTWILRSHGKTKKKNEEKEMVLDYQREESGDGCVLSVAASYLTQQLLLLLHLHPSFTSLLFLHLQKLEQSVRGFLWYDPFASKIPLYQNCMHMRQTIFCNFFTGFANCC